MSEYGFVVGNFIVPPGKGEVPDEIPANGTVTFTPYTDKLIETPTARRVIAAKAVATIKDGVLHGADGEPYVSLITGAYFVQTKYTSGAEGKHFDLEIDDSFTLANPLDLNLYTPITPSPNIIIVASVGERERAERAAEASEASAAEAATSASAAADSEYRAAVQASIASDRAVVAGIQSDAAYQFSLDSQASAAASAASATASAGSATSSANSATQAQNSAQTNAFTYVPPVNATGNQSLASVVTQSIIHWTLTGNVTITAMPSAPTPGMTLSLVLTQGTGGGRTLTLPATVKVPSALAIPLTAAAGSVDVVHLWWTGAIWTAALAARDLR